MGSVGDCFDNAMCESFFATLECELLARNTFRTQNEAQAPVFEYIEGWYNTHRRHSSIDYLSPISYERKHIGVSGPVAPENGFAGCPQSHDLKAPRLLGQGTSEQLGGLPAGESPPSP